MSASGPYTDLVLVAGVTIALIILVQVSPESLARRILGLVYLLFFPGYALMAALFPEKRRFVLRGEVRKSGFRGLERIGLAIGASVALVPVLGLIVNFSSIGITVGAVIVTYSAFVFACLAVTAVRRAGLGADLRNTPDFDAPVRSLRRSTPLARRASLLVLIAIINVAFSITVVLAITPAPEAYTTFAITDRGGGIAAFPLHVAVGETNEVRLRVENHEWVNASYDLRVHVTRGEWVDPEDPVFRPLDRRPFMNQTFVLVAGAAWEYRLSFTAVEPGSYRFTYTLNRDGAGVEPYRQLETWTDARVPLGPPAPGP